MATQYLSRIFSKPYLSENDPVQGTPCPSTYVGRKWKNIVNGNIWVDDTGNGDWRKISV